MKIIKKNTVISCACILVFLIACPFARTDAPVMLIHRYQNQGETLNLVTLIQRENESDLVPVFPDISHYPKYFHFLSRYINAWVPETYISMGLIQRGSAIHESLLREERPMDHRSNIVFVTEENDLSKIKAFVRFSRRGYTASSRRLPLELRNPAIQLPTAPVIEIKVGGVSAYASGVAEIKNFIQVNGLNYNYLSLLMWRAIHSGALDYTFHKEMVEGKLVPVVPFYFSAETHQGVLSYFIEECGFELMEDISDPTKPFQFYIQTSLENAHHLDRRFSTHRQDRKPPVEVHPGKLKQILWQPVTPKEQGCEGVLTSKLPFFKELK